MTTCYLGIYTTAYSVLQGHEYGRAADGPVSWSPVTHLSVPPRGRRSEFYQAAILMNFVRLLARAYLEICNAMKGDLKEHLGWYIRWQEYFGSDFCTFYKVPYICYDFLNVSHIDWNTKFAIWPEFGCPNVCFRHWVLGFFYFRIKSVHLSFSVFKMLLCPCMYNSCCCCCCCYCCRPSCCCVSVYLMLLLL